VPISRGGLAPTGASGRNLVIRLTRLNNQQITVNSDLIKWIECKPDTVLTLINGEKILVHESEKEILARIIEFRRAVISGLCSSAAMIADAASVSASIQQVQSQPHTEEESSLG
jgi:flagellar protein FlbD